MRKDIYLISGLGADQRVFDFLDLSVFNVYHIQWIDPLPNEPIESYSSRLMSQIKSKSPLLLGVSFGGLIAIEISKQIPIEKVILVSSVKIKSDLPLIYRLIGKAQLDKIIPACFLKKVNVLLYWFFGVESDSDKKLLRTIVEETDSVFLKWAIRKIVSWENETILKNTFHIHGNADRILPAGRVDEIIPGGGHFMIVNKSKEISERVKSQI